MHMEFSATAQLLRWFITTVISRSNNQDVRAALTPDDIENSSVGGYFNRMVQRAELFAKNGSYARLCSTMLGYDIF